MKIVKPIIISVALAVVLAGPLLVRHFAGVRWRAQQQTARQQAVLLERLLDENAQLSNVIAQAKTPEPLSDAQLQDLLKLRNEAGRLHRTLGEMGQLRRRIDRLRNRLGDAAKEEESPDNYTALLADELPKRQERVARLKRWFEDMPEEKIPELNYLSENDWIEKVDDPLVTDDDYRTAASRLRSRAGRGFARRAFPALKQYAQANDGQFPTDLSQLKPYFESPIDDAILQRYDIVPAKSLVSYLAQTGGDWLITQKTAVNPADERLAIGLTDCRSTVQRGRWDPVP
jgi:hypothetical protein